MSASKRELEKAKEYRARFTGEKAEFKRAQFSKGVEDSVAEASKYLSFFDIETGGLKPDSPIYEMGFMHLEKDGGARFSQHFVNPTEIHTKNPGRIDQWSLDKINARGKDFGDILASSNISQKQAPGIAYREMHGRDVVIQNMRFEREALNARTGPAIFDSAARAAKLESFSSGRGLFPTNMAVKEHVAEASRLGNTGNLGSYLNAWEDVFTKGIAPMFAEKKEGVTRAFDLMDLTKSVFAMAQKRNLMGNAGELFTGVSVGAFSKAMYGIDEAHIANMDNILAGEMFHSFMGAGHAMARGEELPDEMKQFFKNMTDMVPEQKQRNTVKNIIETFRDQQAFLASEATGKPDWSLLEGSRITANITEANIPVNVLNDAGQYEKATASFPMRERLTPEGDRAHFSTDINQVVQHWEARVKDSHGIKADYQAALAEARETFINPYNKALAASKAQGLSGGAAITSALETSKPELTKALSSLESKAWTSTTPPAQEAGGFKNFIKNNWKIGLVGAGALFAYNMISSKDDEYNYIEGMRHGGISGGSRKQNTDFGSGWRGLIGVPEFIAKHLNMTEAASVPHAKNAVSKLLRDFSPGNITKSMTGRRRGTLSRLIPKENVAERKAAAKYLVDLRQAKKAGIQRPVFINTEKFNKIDRAQRGTFLKGFIKHERTHQLETGLHSGHVPAGAADILTSAKLGYRPDELFSEYNAYKAQYQAYPKSLGGNPLRRYFRDVEGIPERSRPPTHKITKAEPPVRSSFLEGLLRIFKKKEPAIPGRPASNTQGTILLGFPEQGMAKANRFTNTDGQFASPWLGLRNLAVDAVTESSEQYALFAARQRNQERQEEKKKKKDYLEGLNPSFGGDLATINIDNFAVEDADTIRMFMANGQETSIRLAGIDAPEIQHEQDDGSRIWPDQPYGQEAKSRLQEILAQQSNLRAIIDPQATETYGRPVGMLIGDQGQNINLQLVREGVAASLPFGKRNTQITNATEFNRAEADAAAAQEGMWSTDAWQIARQMQMNSKRKITNVTYTDLGRLFSNFKASSILTRMRNPEAEFSEMQASGDRSDFNTIEGLKHGWVGANRDLNTDFGSPYQIDTSKIPRMPTSYRSKKRVIEGQYLANTQLRQSMKRENVVKHYRG